MACSPTHHISGPHAYYVITPENSCLSYYVVIHLLWKLYILYSQIGKASNVVRFVIKILSMNDVKVSIENIFEKKMKREDWFYKKFVKTFQMFVPK
jgi:hypothetical protein